MQEVPDRERDAAAATRADEDRAGNAGAGAVGPGARRHADEGGQREDGQREQQPAEAGRWPTRDASIARMIMAVASSAIMV